MHAKIQVVLDERRREEVKYVTREGDVEVKHVRDRVRVRYTYVMTWFKLILSYVLAGLLCVVQITRYLAFGGHHSHPGVS